MRLREDSLVELEPAQLAVDVEGRIFEVGRIRALDRRGQCGRGTSLPLGTSLYRLTWLGEGRFSRDVHE